MPSLEQLVPFLIASLALNLTPGADMTYVMARSAAQGRGAGIAASFGVAAGSFVHSLLAALGVSALLAHSPTAFLAVRVIGALYLVYLAWKAFTRGIVDTADAADRRKGARQFTQVFLEGMLTNLLNPKVALFILAFLPQFVVPAQGSVIGQILLLGLLFNIGGTAVNCAVAWSAGLARSAVFDSPSTRRWLDRFTGIVFIYLAIRLALAKSA